MRTSTRVPTMPPGDIGAPGASGRCAVILPQRLPGQWHVEGISRLLAVQHLEADFHCHLILRNPALFDEPPQLDDLKPA